MGTIRVRFITVALVVSFFAVGMAAFLNYFKYKSTIGGIVKSRVLVVGRSIENSVQASLALGMQFTELATLPSQMEREKASDRLIRGIDVFDDTGQIIYSTDAARVGSSVDRSWRDAAARAKSTEWNGESPQDYVAGISLKNNFATRATTWTARRTRRRARSPSPPSAPSPASPSSHPSR
jgi:hypothetical protein